jgi:Protein of unknown function (DUF3224)
MSSLFRTQYLLALGIILSFTFGSFAYTQTPSPVTGTIKKETNVTTRASGTFEVKVTPQTPGDSGIGRMLIDKQFQGDLKGTSKVEMLAMGTAVEGSAGYVAMELVNGTLNGRTGTFALQHSGTMTRGTPQLNVTVVPDSGTGELKGLSGKMSIVIADGKHSYEFEYAIAAQ